MKQMQIQQKEAFLLSTLTPVSKKNIIYLLKNLVGIKCKEKFLTPQTVPLTKRVFSALSIVSLYAT